MHAAVIQPNGCLQTHFSSSASSIGTRGEKPRSPYAVLKLRTSASKDAIKAAFRRLAKQYHPDVNTTHSRKESEARMAELIDAYDRLMDDDFGGRIGDSRVALACEVYSIPELRIDRLHDIHSLKIKMVDDGVELSQQNVIDEICSDDDDISTADISAHTLVEIEAHPHDSVSDLKRHIQSIFGAQWGLSGRRNDRDGNATGRELVNDTDGSILSYHLFLDSYGIKDGDIVHAVVRKYSEVEWESAVGNN